MKKKNKNKRKLKIDDTLELEIDEDEEDEEEEEEIEEVKKKSHKVLNFFIFLTLIVILIFFYSKYVGTDGLIVKEYRIESKILTKNYDSLKIVHFSDLLYKSTIKHAELKNLVNRINELNPDIVVFTGDLVNKNIKINEEDAINIENELTKINASIGKYAIYGDADFKLDNYEEIITNSGFKLLNNSYDEIFNKTNDPLYIVGLPSSIKETIDLNESFKFYNEEDRRYIIVLVHDGNTIKYIDESNYEVDLILGGHSLNGSVVIPFYGGILKEPNTYKYSKPEYEKGITKIYISSGLGTNDYEYRFLNKPSFNFYRLKSIDND